MPRLSQHTHPLLSPVVAPVRPFRPLVRRSLCTPACLVRVPHSCPPAAGQTAILVFKTMGQSPSRGRGPGIYPSVSLGSTNAGHNDRPVVTACSTSINPNAPSNALSPPCENQTCLAPPQTRLGSEAPPFSSLDAEVTGITERRERESENLLLIRRLTRSARRTSRPSQRSLLL